MLLVRVQWTKRPAEELEADWEAADRTAGATGREEAVKQIVGSAVADVLIRGQEAHLCSSCR